MVVVGMEEGVMEEEEEVGVLEEVVDSEMEVGWWSIIAERERWAAIAAISRTYDTGRHEIRWQGCR